MKKKEDKMKKHVIEISEETYLKIKEQLEEDELEDELGVINELDDLIGKAFFFRAITYHLVGMVESRIKGTNILRLSTASWVADSGRFMDAIKKGTLSEVEPVGIAFINIDTVTDFFPWKHKLPTKQK